MPIGTRYSYGYIHKRKEVFITIQTGSSPPIHIVMGVEAFLSDLDYMAKDKALTGFLAFVREKKDLPVDYDFGPGGGDFNFNDWENKMKGDQ